MGCARLRELTRTYLGRWSKDSQREQLGTRASGERVSVPPLDWIDERRRCVARATGGFVETYALEYRGFVAARMIGILRFTTIQTFSVPSRIAYTLRAYAV
jgi:hypothetical protein